MVRSSALGFALLLAIFGGAGVVWFAPGSGEHQSFSPRDPSARPVVDVPNVVAAEVSAGPYPDGLPRITQLVAVERTDRFVTFGIAWEDSNADVQRVEWQRPEGQGRMTTGVSQILSSSRYKPTGGQYIELPCSPGDIAFLRVADVAGNKTDWRVAELDCLECPLPALGVRFRTGLHRPRGGPNRARPGNDDRFRFGRGFPGWRLKDGDYESDRGHNHGDDISVAECDGSAGEEPVDRRFSGLAGFKHAENQQEAERGPQLCRDRREKCRPSSGSVCGVCPREPRE